jgi:hypothetical protein
MITERVLTWDVIHGGGVDLDFVEREQNPHDLDLELYVVRSHMGTTRLLVSEDDDGGWTVMEYDRSEDDEGGWSPAGQAPEYFGSEQVDALLEHVRTWLAARAAERTITPDILDGAGIDSGRVSFQRCLWSRLEKYSMIARDGSSRLSFYQDPDGGWTVVPYGIDEEGQDVDLGGLATLLDDDADVNEVLDHVRTWAADH